MVVTTGEAVRFECKLARGRELELSAFRIDDAIHRRVGVILSDVTIRKRADAALNESEALFRELNADLERRVAFKVQARGRTWQLTPDLLGALNSGGYFETSSPAG